MFDPDLVNLAVSQDDIRVLLVGLTSAHRHGDITDEEYASLSEHVADHLEVTAQEGLAR